MSANGTTGDEGFQPGNDYGADTWWARRRKALEKHGLWEKYSQVPVPEERDEPVAAYLPGGSEYREPESGSEDDPQAGQNAEGDA